MKFGVVFPQTEFGNDPVAIRDYAQTAEELGYRHILVYDHVLGVRPERPEEWRGPYTYEDPFYSPLLLFSYMAGLTTTLRFIVGILILPQRQTVLVAKQAASLDVLSGGRFRLGVGIGWNAPEMVALGYDFHTRGRRIEEQIALLRELWMNPVVSFEGRWESISNVGINPLPVQRPIPVWIGGNAEAVLRRTARLGDGWLPNYRSAEDARPQMDKLDQYLAEAGRSRQGFGIEARIGFGDGSPARIEEAVASWQEVGADYVDVNTMRLGFTHPTEHIEALRQFASIVGIG